MVAYNKLIPTLTNSHDPAQLKDAFSLIRELEREGSTTLIGADRGRDVVKFDDNNFTLAHDYVKAVRKEANALTKEGKSPAEIAQKVGQDLNVVEKLQNAAIKNVKEEFGMAPETTSATGTTSTGSPTGDAIQGNKIKREDIKISEMPMSGNVDRDKIQFDDE